MKNFNNSNLGICVKDQNKKVISQNEQCIKLCGDRINQTCEVGCMKEYNTNMPKSFAIGMTLFENVKSENGLMDTVVINDGQNLTTIAYDKTKHSEVIKKDIEKAKMYDLTKSELNILELVLSGKKNREIAKELFISEATLKTHLNNIYKKLPKEWQLLKERK